MMNYVKKSKLKTANSNAKLVFTTVNNEAADMLVEGTSVTGSASQSSAVQVKSLQKASPTTAVDKLANAVYNALKDNGDGAGYCLYMINDDGSVKFAQWCDVEAKGATKGVLGQYPNPCKDADNANKVFSSTAYTSASWKS